jgi:hypothetical protein
MSVNNTNSNEISDVTKSYNITPNAPSFFSTLLQHQTVIHIVFELIIIASTSVYFYRKINGLQDKVKELEKKVDTYEKLVNDKKIKELSELSAQFEKQISSLSEFQNNIETYVRNSIIKMQEVNRQQISSTQNHLKRQLHTDMLELVKKAQTEIATPPPTPKLNSQKDVVKEVVKEVVKDTNDVKQQEICTEEYDLLTSPTIPTVKSVDMMIISEFIPVTHSKRSSVIIEEDNTDELDNELEDELKELE